MTDPRESIALHEAAHAAIAHSAGIDFDEVSILPNENSRGRLLCKTIDLSEPVTEESRVRAACELAVFMAGAIAEGGAMQGPDLTRAKALAAYITGGDEEAVREFLGVAKEATAEWLAEPEVAVAVEAIKAKLLERGRVEGWRARLAITMTRRETWKR